MRVKSSSYVSLGERCEWQQNITRVLPMFNTSGLCVWSFVKCFGLGLKRGVHLNTHLDLRLAIIALIAPCFQHPCLPVAYIIVPCVADVGFYLYALTSASSDPVWNPWFQGTVHTDILTFCVAFGCLTVRASCCHGSTNHSLPLIIDLVMRPGWDALFCRRT